jgi:hypothetical protein
LALLRLDIFWLIVCKEVLLVLTFLPEYRQYPEHATGTVLFHIYEEHSLPQL